MNETRLSRKPQRYLVFLLPVFVSLGFTARAEVVEYRIEREKSIIALITKKAGVGAAMAHNHLIAAGRYDAVLKAAEGDPSRLSFTFEMQAQDLVVDDPDLQKRWAGVIQDAGVVPGPGYFSEVSEENRAKIRNTMLGESQLQAETHPKIAARLRSLNKPAPGAGQNPEFPSRASVELEVTGKTAESGFDARVEWEGEKLILVAFGDFRFTDFGIEPYSAFLGAVQNADEFTIYAHLVAVPAKDR